MISGINITLDNFVEEQGDANSREDEVAAHFEDVNRASGSYQQGIRDSFDIAVGHDGHPVRVYGSQTVENTEENCIYD